MYPLKHGVRVGQSQRLQRRFKFEGWDIIGVAAHWSGKTAAFVLLSGVTPDSAITMGGVAGSIRMRFTRCAVVIDGAQNKVKQVALAKKPHVIVATPGRLNNHLETTEGFSLRIVKFLVFDEADQLLTLNFQPDIATS